LSKNTILVIGGAGYVGSHFARHALDRGFDVTIADNLSKGHIDALKCSRFVMGDLRDRSFTKELLATNRYSGIFHFAASCLVGESVVDPAQYYENNVIAAYNMLEAMKSSGHDRVVFSSTCAVYGLPQRLPITEDHPKNPISPYGRSKLAIEWMLEDYQRAHSIRSACLRYFNAAGCEPGHGLGEDHRPETHLIPNAVRFALGRQPELVIHGGDYPTPDGTCIRDYIHVTDLAEAHLKALARLDENALIRLNLGTGNGLSNLEVLAAVGRVTGRKLSPKIGPRRPGDPPALVADSGQAFRELEWQPSRSNLESMVSEVLRWASDYPDGYAR